MTKYRGYYIDNVVFSSKKDIDEFVKQSLINKLKSLNEMLLSPRYSGKEKLLIVSEISIREHKLHDEFGMSYEEIENLEY